jgi:hypothetical protein
MTSHTRKTREPRAVAPDTVRKIAELVSSVYLRAQDCMSLTASASIL